MTPSRFARLLDTHGARPEAWPTARRAEAEALLGRSAEARRQLAAAQRLDAALERALPQPSPAALARLQARVAREIARSPLPAPPHPWAHAWARLGLALRPAAPAGYGALAAMATCALWLSLAPSPAVSDPIGDPLAPLQTLPLAEDPL
ncbi:hypothetical protein [Roseicella sp. DB1501]|uniref:hypothetical protein n=1 Tax=Roseicella sp. DB1501 TaxID=2730925 RepID=UPI001491E4A4|nr:hypothetical protein [Roseicella sp. DB1501]NOG71023.1 hypothetical protein [Roseicella sp. DB1501]